MWFNKKTAVNTETGESFPVFALLGRDEPIMYPTMFFAYFNNIPVFNVFSLNLHTMSIGEINNVSEEEIQEIFSDLNLLGGIEVGRMEEDSKKRKN